MLRSLRAHFVIILMVTVVAAAFLSAYRIRPGMDLAGGAELRYQVLLPDDFKGDPHAATELAAEVVRRRVDATLLQAPKVSTHGKDGLLIQLPGADADGLETCKRRLGKLGDLRLYASAPTAL